MAAARRRGGGAGPNGLASDWDPIGGQDEHRSAFDRAPMARCPARLRASVLSRFSVFRQLSFRRARARRAIGRALRTEPHDLRRHRTNRGAMRRMASDGELSLTAGDVNDGQWRVGLGFQLLPWLEASFRYSHVPDFFGRGSPSSTAASALKSGCFRKPRTRRPCDRRARHCRHRRVRPGIWSLSKRFWTFDFTAGLGWGRLASTDMLTDPLGIADPVL